MVLLALLVLITLMSVAWLFRSQAKRANMVMLVLIALGITAGTAYGWLTTGHSVDSGWWPVTAVMFSTLLVLAVVLGAVVVRIVGIVRRRHAR